MTFLQTTSGCRSHTCGSVTEDHVGQKITVCGWVDKRRNLGGLLFLDIRDHSGILQTVSSTENAAVTAIGETLRQEWVVTVTGTLQARKDINEKIPTGRVELLAEEISVLNRVNRKLPFPVSEAEEQEAPR
jgi:aspartyl-tRNA synthetase